MNGTLDKISTLFADAEERAIEQDQNTFSQRNIYLLWVLLSFKAY